MLKIIYEGFVFEDANDDIDSASGALHLAPISESLYADDFTFIAKFNPYRLGYYINDPVNGSDFLRTKFGEIVCVRAADAEQAISTLEDFEYARPAFVYDDDELKYVFYVTNIAPQAISVNGTITFEFTCMSVIGLMIYQTHNGGMYVNSTNRAIIQEILQATYVSTTAGVEKYSFGNGLFYYIDTDVANTRVDGHLPIASRRDNLQDVLCACGASVLKTSDGSLHFVYNTPSAPIGISADRIYMGDRYATSERVTKVTTTEHSYYQLTGTEDSLLYDSGAEVADHYKVVFDAPAYSIHSDTLTIHESNCNYAIVSGSGELYGKGYTHTMHQLSQDTDVSGLEKEVGINENELVSALNATSVLRRLASYYSEVKNVSADFVVENGVSTGSLISFRDPLNRQKTGLVTELQFNISGIVKGGATIATNWVPQGGGTYTHSVALSGSGTFTVPSGVQSMRVILIQGGQGGQAGYNGTDATLDSSISENYNGEGGAAGEKGGAGKIYQADISVSAGQQFPYSCGAAGKGGASNGAIGTNGGHSTFGSMSSENGAIPQTGILNPVTGDVYSADGIPGIDGARGGGWDVRNGFDVVYSGVTYKGGTAGRNNTSGRYYVYGGNGGGAAYGANGGNGGDANTEFGNGGAGANASVMPYSPTYGSGGAGGNGGGGGGADGPSFYDDGSGRIRYRGNPGLGGKGSKGTDGGAGAVVLIY